MGIDGECRQLVNVVLVFVNPNLVSGTQNEPRICGES